MTPEEWWVAVLAADGWRSRLSGCQAAPGDPLEAHHCVPKCTLRRHGLYGWVWAPDNGIALLRSEHARHTAGCARVPYLRLPARVVDFAEGLGPWAVSALEREHPRGGPRDP